MCDYKLHFGVPLEVSSLDPQSESGIYCIFAKKPGYDRLEKLIYIGKAEDMKKRFYDHEKIGDWENEAGSMTLYCSIAWLSGTSEDELSEIECEMIGTYIPECPKHPLEPYESGVSLISEIVGARMRKTRFTATQ